MRTLLALALLATFVVQAATPREAQNPAASLAVPSGLRGVPQYVTRTSPATGDIGTSVPVPGGGTPSTPAAALPSTGAPVSVPARYSASATWCAPTPTQCQSWGGNAMFGAVFSFRDGDQAYWVHVTRGDRFADVLVVSFCACRGTLNAIDLSPAAFVRLAPLSRGRIDVTVEVLSGPAVTLPPTDVADQSGDDPPSHPDDERMRLEVRGDTLYEGGTE